MTESKCTDKLRQYRPLIMALEAIGWLHMTGKASRHFLLHHAGQDDNYNFKDWHNSLAKPWNDCWGWINKPKELKFPNAFDEFLKKFDQRQENNAVGLLQAGHAMASGIEKNLPGNTSRYLGQDAKHMWLNSAFGHPSRNLLTVLPELFTNDAWSELLKSIDALLAELEILGKEDSDKEKWWQWREKAIGQSGWLRKAFSSTLAETRLPNNDVTLWDQSYVAAALFKSAVVGAVLKGNGFNWQELKQKTQWRLLTIGLGADHYETRAVRIGDWTGVILEINDFFDDICKLVEVEVPLGALLYRDQRCLVFSFPGERMDGNGALDDQAAKSIQDWLQTEVDSLAQERNFETPPYCQLSASSRSLIRMTRELQNSWNTLAIPAYRNWTPNKANVESGHVCPVCLIRKNGDPTNKQKLCDTCRKRRTHHRLQAWREEKSVSDTIWISEVADTNDRAALLTFSLDIDWWLDGTRVDSLRAQAASEWCRKNSAVQKHGISVDHAFQNLVDYIKGKISDSFNSDDPVLCLLHEGYRHEKKGGDNRSDGEIWKSFFDKIVEDRVPSEELNWNDLSNEQRAHWIGHQLLRKNASPGRVYRFQKQAEDFFITLLAEFRKIAAVNRNSWRPRRLLLKPAGGSWEDGEPYNGRIEGKSIDLLYDMSAGGFITIFNLARILDPNQGRDCFTGRTVSLKNDDNKPVGSFTVETAEEMSEYQPIIPLEISPRRFRVLVPLESASECIDQALNDWKLQFNRVWDRLPLRVGVVAFPRMTPYQAVIEATRQLEFGLAEQEQETWRMGDNKVRDGVASLHLKREDGGCELYSMSVQLPDGRDDVFYPYLAVEDRQIRYPLDFQHPQGQVYRHARDLKTGDAITVCPSSVTWMSMDNTARRFDRPEVRPISDWTRIREIWHLLKRTVPGKTALRSAWAMLVERRESWQSPAGDWLEGGEQAWLDLARSVFRNRLRARGLALDTLVAAARDGTLDWALDWHLSVLKESIEERPHD